MIFVCSCGVSFDRDSQSQHDYEIFGIVDLCDTCAREILNGIGGDE